MVPTLGESMFMSLQEKSFSSSDGVKRQRQSHTGVIDSKVFRNNLWEEKTFKSAKLRLNDLLGIFSENLKKKVNYSITVLEPLRQF